LLASILEETRVAVVPVCLALCVSRVGMGGGKAHQSGGSHMLVVMSAAAALGHGPGYLSYFNAFVRPAESCRLLTDSNLDWGLSLLALRQYQVSLSLSGTLAVLTWDLWKVGICFTQVAPIGSMRGWHCPAESDGVGSELGYRRGLPGHIGPGFDARRVRLHTAVWGRRGRCEICGSAPRVGAKLQ
jgi:hypothetical protein